MKQKNLFVCTLFLGFLILTAAVGCQDPRKDPPVDPAGPTIDVVENFDFSAISDREHWEGGDSKNPVFDQNGFVTFREKSNANIAYGKVGMSTGSIELQMKLTISTDTNATVNFSNQSEDLSAFCYAKGGRMYALDFGSDSKMTVKKWINGTGTKLAGSKDSVSVPLAFSMDFTAMRIEVAEEESRVSIRVYQGTKLLLDVADGTDPILGGGAVGVSYTGKGGMAIGSKSADTSKYEAPEALGMTIYDSPDVPVATGDVDLLADFSEGWTGRNRIFHTKQESGSVTFESKDNPEEPQAGVTEYQGLYRQNIFKNVQFEYEFNVLSHGEWIMFWFRCVPEKTTDVSIWGNKSTKENTNGYSMLITTDGYVQVHKWSDFAQIWVNGQGTQLPGEVRSLFSDSKQTIRLKMSMEEIEVGGNQAVEFRIKVNDSQTVVVQDTDTPFLNAGYTGVQGYGIGNGVSSIRLTSAAAKSELTL